MRFVRLRVRRGVVAGGVGAVVGCSEDETRGEEIVGVESGGVVAKVIDGDWLKHGVKRLQSCRAVSLATMACLTALVERCSSVN